MIHKSSIAFALIVFTVVFNESNSMSVLEEKILFHKESELVKTLNKILNETAVALESKVGNVRDKLWLNEAESLASRPSLLANQEKQLEKLLKQLLKKLEKLEKLCT